MAPSDSEPGSASESDSASESGPTSAPDSTSESGSAAGPDSAPSSAGAPLLSVRDLRTHFHTDEGTVRAVDGVSFDVRPGETVCLVGESGSGKTVTSESITRLFQSPPGEIVSGEIVFDGVDLTGADQETLRRLRGARIAHVFQNPQGALNPVYSVGWQLREAIRLHRDVEDADAVAIDLLERVGIPDARARLKDYPHELSGGMKQRVMVAMALAGQPDLLIADEPTTALDVTIQAQLLTLLRELQADLGMSILFITHDLGVVAEIADRVVVMYAGTVLERGDVYDVFDRPAHPYTRALLACLPGRGSLRGIPGAHPDPTAVPAGCRFHPRCEHAVEACRTGDPPPLYAVDSDRSSGTGDGDVGRDHVASCVYYGPGYDPAALDEDEDAEQRTGSGGDGL